VSPSITPWCSWALVGQRGISIIAQLLKVLRKIILTNNDTSLRNTSRPSAFYSGCGMSPLITPWCSWALVGQRGISIIAQLLKVLRKIILINNDTSLRNTNRP
jgi:hypothetical protein